jgi:hypothetical protein
MKPQAAKILTKGRVIIFIFFIISSVQCSKYEGETEQYAIDSPAAGTQVVPATASTATGKMVGIYNSNKNMLTGAISWAGLSGAPTYIHIHGPARAGLNRANSQLITISKFQASATGSVIIESPMTESQEGSMIDKMIYFDIHTAAYPNGEIRGQIILQ